MNLSENKDVNVNYRELYLENGGVLLQPEDQLSDQELSKEYDPDEKSDGYNG